MKPIKWRRGQTAGDHELQMISRDHKLRLANGCSSIFGVLNQLVNPELLSDNSAPLYDLLKTPDQLIQVIPALSFDVTSIRRIYEIVPGYTIRVLAESGVYENLTTAKQVDEWLKLEVQVRNAEHELRSLENVFENSCDDIDPTRQLLMLSYRQENLSQVAPSDWKQMAKEFTPYKNLDEAITATDARISGILSKCAEFNRHRFRSKFEPAKEAFFVAYRAVNELCLALGKARPVPPTRLVDTRSWPILFEKYKRIYLQRGASLPLDPDEDVSVDEEETGNSAIAPIEFKMKFRMRPVDGQSSFGAMFAPRVRADQRLSATHQLHRQTTTQCQPETTQCQQAMDQHAQYAIEAEASTTSVLNPLGLKFKFAASSKKITPVCTSSTSSAIPLGDSDAIVEPALKKKPRV